jgi:hypothetical protein
MRRLLIMLLLLAGLRALPVHIMRVEEGRMYLAFDQAAYIGLCAPGPAVAVEAFEYVLVVGERCIAVAE